MQRRVGNGFPLYAVGHVSSGRDYGVNALRAFGNHRGCCPQEIVARATAAGPHNEPRSKLTLPLPEDVIAGFYGLVRYSMVLSGVNLTKEDHVCGYLSFFVVVVGRFLEPLLTGRFPNAFHIHGMGAIECAPVGSLVRILITPWI